MLQRCFYLLAVLTTIVSFTFSNVSLYPEGTNLPLGSLNLKIRDLAPQTVDWPATNLTSTSDALSFNLASPLAAEFTVQVYTVFWWTPARIQVTMSGGASYTKSAANSCDSVGRVRDYCDTKARVVIRGVSTNIQIADVTIDVCDQLESLLGTALATRTQESLPTLTTGATDISRLLYFKKFAMLGGLSQSMSLPYSKKFIAKNAMQVSTGLVLPLLFDFDTSNEITSTTIDLATTVTNAVKKMLNISTYDNVTDATTVVEYQGGTIAMPSLKNLFHQIVTKEARAALQAYVPAGASMVYDMVVNDLQCRFFNTICSIPATNGIQVINSHFTGFGDLNGILDNALGKAVDETMTDAVFTAVKATSVLTGNRYYLSII